LSIERGYTHTDGWGNAANDGNNRLTPGDYHNIAGVNSPEPIHVPINGDSCETHTPENEMISKERWETIKEIILRNPDLCEHFDLVMDHFAGYSWGELGQRYNMSRDVARGRVTKCIEYLRKQIIGKQF
jgi:hypothetical protein